MCGGGGARCNTDATFSKIFNYNHERRYWNIEFLLMFLATSILRTIFKMYIRYKVYWQVTVAKLFQMRIIILISTYQLWSDKQEFKIQLNCVLHTIIFFGWDLNIWTYCDILSIITWIIQSFVLHILYFLIYSAYLILWQQTSKLYSHYKLRSNFSSFHLNISWNFIPSKFCVNLFYLKGLKTVAKRHGASGFV